MTVRENLLVLIDAVENEPEQKFDLSTFEQQNSCGTLHCTLGLAATLPHFQAQGLALLRRPDVAALVSIDGHSVWEPGYSKLDGLFGVESYNRLFEPAEDGFWDEEIKGEGLTDKQLAIARLSKQLEMYL